MHLARISRFHASALLLVSFLGFSCATHEEGLPPLRSAPPAARPDDVRAALPGVWVIEVKASAEVMARAQFRPRQTTLLRREGTQPATHELGVLSEKFDGDAYRRAQGYWADLLKQPDMAWVLTFRADGSGEHRAIIQTGGAPVAVPFQWRLEGWRLHVDYPPDAKFSSFEIEEPSALELHYPMEPLGDYLVLRRQ